jgi:hypothetical protein
MAFGPDSITGIGTGPIKRVSHKAEDRITVWSIKHKRIFDMQETRIRTGQNRIDLGLTQAGNRSSL